MNKTLNKILVSGVSLLMLAGVGASANQASNPVHAASRISRLRARRNRDYHDVKSINAEINKLGHKNNETTHMYPVSAPNWLRGCWIHNGSTSMNVIGYQMKQYKASHQRYWKINKNGHNASYIVAFHFAHKGRHFIYKNGKYILKNGQRPYAVSYYYPVSHNRMHISIFMKSRGHNSIKQFRGNYYKVSYRHYKDIKNGLDTVNNYNF